jgi:O-antigen/teichoic acid export membrane protein
MITIIIFILEGKIMKKIVSDYQKIFRKYFVNVLWSNLNKGMITLFALIISVVFARLTTKELYGNYFFIIAIIGLISLVSMPGIRGVIFKNISQGYEGVYKKTTIFSLKWSLIGIPILILISIYFFLTGRETVGISIFISSFFFPFLTSLQAWMLYFKGTKQFKQLAISNTYKLFFNMVCILLAIIFTKNLIIIIIVYLLVNSSFNLFYHLNILKTLKNNRILNTWKKQSYGLTLMDFSGAVFNQIDIILIGLFLTSSQVAIYGLVMRFVAIFLDGIRSIIDVILPDLYKSKKLVINYFFKYFFLAFLIPMILFYLIKYPIYLLYGNKYYEVITFSQIYIFIIPFFMLANLSKHFLIKYNLNKTINISEIITILITIFSFLLLIPIYGILGGIIGSYIYFISISVINITVLLIYKTGKMSKKNNT